MKRLRLLGWRFLAVAEADHCLELWSLKCAAGRPQMANPEGLGEPRLECFRAGFAEGAEPEGKGAALGQPASFHHLHTYTLCVLGCVSFPLPQNSYVEVLTPVPSECDCI